MKAHSMIERLQALVFILVCNVTLLVILISFQGLLHFTQTAHSYLLYVHTRQEQSLITDAGKVVWLMSFPNSGSSFTTKLVRDITNQSTATNYGEEHVNSMGISEVIEYGKEYENGPFLVLNSEKRKFFNGKFVLTKTHCGGRCSRCNPNQYIETTESFKKDCLTARKINQRNSTFQKVQYGERLVAKAVHIIRDPTDNVVSRFHLFLKMVSKGMITTKENFSNDKKGFRRWCEQQDSIFEEEERVVLEDVLPFLSNIPCHADFYRYIQWHNNAFDVIEKMSIPYMILHYEDFALLFNSTKDQILKFLEAKETRQFKQNSSSAFIKGKRYASYYSTDERKAIHDALTKLGNRETQKHIVSFYYET